VKTIEHFFGQICPVIKRQNRICTLQNLAIFNCQILSALTKRTRQNWRQKRKKCEAISKYFPRMSTPKVF